MEFTPGNEEVKFRKQGEQESLDQGGVLNIVCVISHVYVCSMLAQLRV